MREDLDQYLPLSPATLDILLSVSSEDRHGYGIMQEVARQSDGRYRLGRGTLYDNLQKLLESGIVEESRRAQSTKDPRRRYYRLTGFGRRLL
jgi:DNA-binding PadR family transcriptional regulator